MKVLVVEDEYYARQRLIKIIRESNGEAVLSAALEDGRSAVEYLEQHTDVDVVVTDIMMPRMNGLQLAEYIYKNMPYIQVIIVSGYEEFDYAKTAIEYEVKQYLIKPVSKEILLKTFSQLNEKKENYRKELEEVVKERLSHMPYGFPLSGQILENKKLIGLYLPGFMQETEHAVNRLFVIQLEKPFTQEEAGLVHQICMKRLEGEFYGGFFCKGEDEYVFCTAESLSGDENQSREAAESLLSYLRTRIEALMVISMSGPFSGAGGASGAYKECRHAMNNRLTGGWNHLYEYSNIRTEIKSFDVLDEAMLTKALQASDYEKAAGLVHEFLNRKELLEKNGGNGLYDVIINILRTVNQYYRSLCQEGENRVEIMFSRRYDLYSFKHPKELEDYLFDILHEICNFEQSMDRSGGNAIIKDILHYVDHNYQYDLSLQELAEKKYFMNPSYLSRLFKSAVGKTFSGYVIDLRIEKAKELLEDRALKISDIAALVGYNNSSHFIQSFKKSCGMTPEEMRNQME